jgi:hypothetical protein
VVDCFSARLTSTNPQTKQGDRDSMATKKKEVKVRDLKPSKDAKGGASRNLAGSSTAGRSIAGSSTAGRSTAGHSTAGRSIAGQTRQ